MSLALVPYGIHAVRCRRLEEAGISFEVNRVRDLITLRRDTNPVLKTLKPVDSVGDFENVVDEESLSDVLDVDDEKYLKYLLALDPTKTKEQDHYKVLGLKRARWRATMSQLKSAYRQKVLKHHPDKRRRAGVDVNQGDRSAAEDYFTCITKAYEQLGMSEQKRRSYDSVDPLFDDAVPQSNQVNNDNFFDVLGSAFELNARWSNRQPVPLLGSSSSTRDEVEHFYSFWFDFDSWREFSYLDEEDKEKGEDRWERREIEKVNRAEREKRRKNEAKRMRGLIELAYSKDPRIVQYKKDDQATKEEAKKERLRQQAERKKQEEDNRLTAERAQREAEEAKKASEKEQLEQERRERDEKKKALAAERRRLRTIVESGGHWTDDPTDKLTMMETLERVCLAFNKDQIVSLCVALESTSLDYDVAKQTFAAAEKARDEEQRKKASAAASASQADKDTAAKEQDCPWSPEETQLVVKAANLFPAGTTDRWVCIADYVNTHRPAALGAATKKRTEKEVIKQVKLVQTMGLKATVELQNKLGSGALSSTRAAVDSTTTTATTNSEESDEQPWTPAQQQQLETALRRYPVSNPNRWDEIAKEVEGKTKKQCVARFKQLVLRVKQKKAGAGTSS